jgi:hypothetical protein
MPTEYADFDLEVGRGEVRLPSSPAGEAHVPLKIDV